MEKLISVSFEAVKGQGEDCSAGWEKQKKTFLCVADGCGGSGSRRYPDLDDHTGAYAASRLAVHASAKWAEEQAVPKTVQAGEEMCRSFEKELDRLFRAFADEKCRTTGVKIVGSMQRRLPTTLCIALVENDAAAFFWTGDSRAYVMDANGLHQCTRDDLKGNPDAFDNLYLDRPLSACVSADTDTHLHFAQRTIQSPSLLITATDGAFGSLPTPMEFEMLLMDALKNAKTAEVFRQKIEKSISKIAQDDASLMLRIHGASDYEMLKAALLPRREVLQKQFITPVRRKKGDLAFARARWQLYREDYDWTEGETHA